MFLKKIAFQIFVFIVIILIFSTILASDCEDDCDYPWPPECASYCANQGMALTKRSFSNALIYLAWREKDFLGKQG